MSGRWRDLADHVKSGRAKLGMSQRELAAAAGVSFTTVQTIERAEPRTRIPDKMPAIENVLGWSPGTAGRIVRGEPLSDDDVPAYPLSGEEVRALFAKMLDQDGTLTPREAVRLEALLKSRVRHDA